MPRSVSLNWELEVDSKIVKPQVVGEFGSEEGTLDVVDGEKGYKIGNGIEMIDEVLLEFNVHQNQNPYIDVMEKWVKDQSVKDVFLVGKDSARNVVLNFSLEDTECKTMKNSASDKGSKEVTRKKYRLLPKEINIVT